MLKLFLFLVLIGGALAGGWFGMQYFNGPKDAVVKKKKSKATAAEVAKADKAEPVVEEPEPRTEPMPEPKAKPEPKVMEPPPRKEEPVAKVTPMPEPKVEPKTVPKTEPKTQPKTEPKVDGPLVYFDKHILPIMQKSCIRCHGEGGKKFDGKFDARTAASIIKGGESGPGVIPGQPEKSVLYADNVEPGQMPPRGEGTLSAAEKKLIYDWIKGGAKASATP